MTERGDGLCLLKLQIASAINLLGSNSSGDNSCPCLVGPRLYLYRIRTLQHFPSCLTRWIVAEKMPYRIAQQ